MKVVFWTDVASGVRVVHRGNNANNGGNAGVSYANANNGPSDANANISSPLYFVSGSGLISR
jgi:hypothetical protein